MAASPKPTLPSTFLAVQGVGADTSRKPQLMHELRSLPAILAAAAAVQSYGPAGEAALQVTRPVGVNKSVAPPIPGAGGPPPVGGAMPGFWSPTDGEATGMGQSSAGSTGQGWGTDPASGNAPGAALTDGGVAVPSMEEINYARKENPSFENAADPMTAAVSYLMSHPGDWAAARDYVARQKALDAKQLASGTDPAVMYAQMKNAADIAAANNASTEKIAAESNALKMSSDTQVAAANREQLLLDWHKAQLAAQDAARTQAEKTQMDRMTTFTGLLPYGHAPGFDPLAHRFGDATPEYTVTAPNFVNPAPAYDVNIPQPNIPDIQWPTPAGTP